jgi:hypothetical protein
MQDITTDQLYQRLFIAAYQALVGTENYTPYKVVREAREYATEAYEHLSSVPIDHDMLALIDADKRMVSELNQRSKSEA